jgi:hypothetical protein
VRLSRLETALQLHLLRQPAVEPHVAFDEVFGKQRRACFGRLDCHVPDGAEAGRRVPGIDLEQSTVRLPFDL